MDVDPQSYVLSKEAVTIETINSLPEEFSDLLKALEVNNRKPTEERHEYYFDDEKQLFYHNYPTQVATLIEAFHARVQGVHIVSTPPLFEVKIMTDTIGTFTIHQEEDRFRLENPDRELNESSQIVDPKEMGRLFESIVFDYGNQVLVDGARRFDKTANELDVRDTAIALLINQALGGNLAVHNTTTKQYQLSYPSKNGDPGIGITFSANVSNDGNVAYDILIHADDPDGGHCLLKTHYDSCRNEAVNFLVDGSLWREGELKEPEPIEKVTVALYVEEIIKRTIEDLGPIEKTGSI